MSSERPPLVAAPAAQPSPPAAPAARGGGRASGPGPRRIARVVAAVLIAAVVIVAFAGVLLSRHGGSSATRQLVPAPAAVAKSGSAAPHESAALHGSAAVSPGAAAAHGSPAARSARYGGIPSWLPKARVPVGRVLHASSGHPVLAIQGDTVSVRLRTGRVLATAVGPTVPEEGRFPVPETSPCTFIITFTAATGAIPLSPTAFTFVDELHHVHHPRVTAMDGGAPVTQVLPGQTVSLKVYDVLPTGDGGLEWAPGGARPVVAWDFDVEID